MILHRVDDFIYIDYNSQKFWAHIQKIDFSDPGGSNIRVNAELNDTREITVEVPPTEVVDINGNPYGTTLYDIVSGIYDRTVELSTNTPVGDAFGRLRVSQPYTIFDSKELDGSGDRIWCQQLNGSATSVKSDPLSQYTLGVSADGDFAIRQTFQRFSYQAGKSQLALLTGKLATAADVNSRIGLMEGEVSAEASPFNAYNGMYFSSVDGVFYANIMKNGVETSIAQSSWNLDKMDGSGKSAIDIDFTKVQIFVIDYEWLGVGRVRFGFNVDGVTTYCHQFVHANLTTSVYTKTPNLPIRYEIRSTGGTDTLQKICASVASEGGVEQSGITHIGSSALNTLANNTAGTNNTVLAVIRLQLARPYGTLRLLSMSPLLFSDTPVRWSIALVLGSFEINVNGTPTAMDDLVGSIDLPGTTINYWEAAATGVDTVLESVVSPYTIEEGYVAGSKNSPAAAVQPADNLLTVGQGTDGCRSCFLIYAQAYGANTMRYSLKFKEVI